MSTSSTPTIPLVLPIYENLHQHLLSGVKNHKYSAKLRQGSQRALAKLLKYKSIAKKNQYYYLGTSESIRSLSYWSICWQLHYSPSPVFSGIRKLAWHWAWRAWWRMWWAWLYPTAQDFERGARGCAQNRSGFWAWLWENHSDSSVASGAVSTCANGLWMATSITLRSSYGARYCIDNDFRTSSVLRQCYVYKITSKIEPTISFAACLVVLLQWSGRDLGSSGAGKKGFWYNKAPPIVKSYYIIQ